MRVYIQQGENEIGTILKILQKAKPDIGNKVLIKPNLTMPCFPNFNICTSPKVVEGIIQYLKNQGIKDIVIGEGAGGAKDMSKIFKITGYEELSDKLNIPLINLNQDRIVKLKINNGYSLNEINIAKEVTKRYVINVPKLKTHRMALVSLAMKNMMGIILPYNKKLILHPKYFFFLDKLKSEKRKTFTKKEFKETQEEFFKKLADFYSVYKPNLNIIDGVVGKEGDGLTFGKNIKTNCILLSDNVVAIDYLASYIMNLNLSKSYLNYIKGNKINKLRDIEIISNKNIRKIRKKFNPVFLTEKVAF